MRVCLFHAVCMSEWWEGKKGWGSQKGDGWGFICETRGSPRGDEGLDASGFGLEELRVPHSHSGTFISLSRAIRSIQFHIEPMLIPTMWEPSEEKRPTEEDKVWWMFWGRHYPWIEKGNNRLMHMRSLLNGGAIVMKGHMAYILS